jgi:hypothetical protein
MTWKGQETEKGFFYKINICLLVASCAACAAIVETAVMTDQYTYLDFLKGSLPTYVLVLSQ